ncbi:30S ribosomal protein S4 [Pelotomaculum terephthalicicum JT]|uniref:30S ribosomal protein S4 n=1 Tax=Pelotomaculum TaxID=191373 RepID=UPI0009CA36FC|nr:MULTISPECIES: 30S ribosomal protein S4 [Pelotomaculum]MCG9967875.1 30S ribosomal protein S4 [Pelotomaculum terephthalicicum JT]OPX90995.1 MAG: 30S ribosomal protein S4 [Pelotomaculum sp. PtaB.Bin117]OPY61450.1 MAG: 30S ribosomal protein S4 [Pelotomaculum sp. PtaU1.Bin065]
MARYTEAVCRQCRREGLKLYLKGDRCYSTKCGVDRRAYAPGQHGQGRKKVSEYGLQLREKQKARRIYGILEGQFRRYFVRAERQPGVTGENLLRLLERRLDNAVYRLGLGASRNEARQLVRHGHFMVNGRKVNIPSYSLRVGDVITVREKSKESPRVKELLERAAERTPPAWLEFEADQAIARVVALPARDQIDAPVQEHLIVELYSR